MNRGIAYENKHDLNKAVADYTKAILFNPKYAEAYYYRGLAYTGKDEPDKAITDLDRTIQLDPKNAWAYGRRGLRNCKRD